MVGFPCSGLFYSLLKEIRLKSYSMAFNGNCSAKPSNVALSLEMKQMLTRLNKFSSQFPRLKGFGLITHVNNVTHANVDLASVKLHLSTTVHILLCI